MHARLKLNQVYFKNGYVLMKFVPYTFELGKISYRDFLYTTFLMLTSIGKRDIDPRVAKYLNRPIGGKTIIIEVVFIDYTKLDKFDETISQTNLNDQKLKYYLTCKPSPTAFIEFCKRFLVLVLNKLNISITSPDEKIYIKKLNILIRGGEFQDIYDSRFYHLTLLRRENELIGDPYLVNTYTRTIIKNFTPFR